MKQYIIASILILFTNLSVFGQDPNKMTSTERYVEPREGLLKKGYFTAGLNVSREMFEDNSPFSLFVYGGYEFCRLFDNGIYLGLEPRVRLGYINGNTDDDDEVDQYHTYSAYYNTFSWGGAAAGRIGFVIGDDASPIIYLEAETGLLNFHSKGRVKQYEKPRSFPVQDSYANFTIAGRIGLMGETSSGVKVALWVGVSNINTDMFLDKMDFKSNEILGRKLDGEIGLMFFF